MFRFYDRTPELSCLVAQCKLFCYKQLVFDSKFGAFPLNKNANVRAPKREDCLLISP